MRLITGLFRFLLVAAIVLAVVYFGFAFLVNNQQSVSIDLVVLQLPQLELGIWLVIFFVAGALLGMAMSSALLFSERVARKRVERRLQTTSKLITGETQ